MSIYNKTFKPTWLYIKQHNKTGLKYFGKTIQNPLKYIGSSTYWKSHLKKHGQDITTIWIELFINEERLINFAINFSIKNDIVNSNEWANLIIENGKGLSAPPIRIVSGSSNSHVSLKSLLSVIYSYLILLIQKSQGNISLT